MRKFLVLSFLLILPLTLYWLSGSKEEQDQEIFKNENKKSKVLLAPKLQKKLKHNRKETLKKILEKKHQDITKTKSFETFTEDKPLDDFKDKEFLNKTFHTLLECYKEGCGQGADHDGYYNEAQTVAAVTLNRILKAGLESDNLEARNWMSEDELLGLFSSKNERTRDLAFKHLMSRGAPESQIEKILTTANDLNGYELGSAMKNISSNLTEETTPVFIESIVTFLKTKDFLAKVEILKDNTNVKVTRNQIEQIFDACCESVKDINNGQAVKVYANEWATNSGHQIDVIKHCQ